MLSKCFLAFSHMKNSTFSSQVIQIIRPKNHENSRVLHRTISQQSNFGEISGNYTEIMGKFEKIVRTHSRCHVIETTFNIKRTNRSMTIGLDGIPHCAPMTDLEYCVVVTLWARKWMGSMPSLCLSQRCRSIIPNWRMSPTKYTQTNWHFQLFLHLWPPF